MKFWLLTWAGSNRRKDCSARRAAVAPRRARLKSTLGRGATVVAGVLACLVLAGLGLAADRPAALPPATAAGLDQAP